MMAFAVMLEATFSGGKALRRAMAAGLALAASLSLCAPAAAQLAPSSLRADPFSALVGKRQPAAEREAANMAVERFMIATGERVFLFQSEGGEGRLKFLCGDDDPRLSCEIDRINPVEEIYLLTAERVSRGDVQWRTAEGETLLRVAAYGGVTAFYPGDPRGHAASKSFGEDPPLTLDFATIETAQARARAATALISAKVGAPIVFDIGDPRPDAYGGASVLADAVARAADGVARVSRDPTGAKVVSLRVSAVRFVSAPAPDVAVDKGVLTIDYDPAGDVAGRPSSARISRFLEESL